MKLVLFLFLTTFQSADTTSGLQYYQRAYALQQQGDSEAAIRSYEQALTRADLKESDRAGVLINLAILRKNKGQYDRALEHAFDALGYTRDSTRSRSSALNNIAAIYFLTGDYSKALEYDQKTLAIRRIIAYEKGVAMSLSNISNIFIAVEQYDSAVAYLNRGLQISEELNNLPLIARLHNNLGLAHLNLNHYEEAQHHLSRALTLKQQNQLTASLPYTYRLLGVLATKQGHEKLAAQYLHETIALSEQHQIPSVKKDALADLAALYAQLGDHRRQSDVLRQYIVLSDSLLNEEKTKALTEMEVKYESDQKDQEISYLEALERLQSAEIANQRNLIILVSLFGLASFVAGAFMWHQYRQSQQQKKKIEVLHADMKHRVSNHLQLLLGLLKMQKSEVEETAALEVIKSIENRVSAMTLVHQKLFLAKEELHMDIQPYFEELALLLDASLQSIRPLQLTTRVASVRLDVNLVIYMGLIVSELVTNAVKHAFLGVDAPRIDLILETKTDQLLFLEVRDNGTGIDPDNAAKSSGSELIRLFSQQIHAETSAFNYEGAVFQFLIPHKPL